MLIDRFLLGRRVWATGDPSALPASLGAVLCCLLPVTVSAKLSSRQFEQESSPSVASVLSSSDDGLHSRVGSGER